MGGDSAEDEDGFSGDGLEEREGEEGLGVAGGRGGERVAGGEGIGGGLSDGEGWDGGGGGGVSGRGFGGDEDGEVGEGEEVGGGGEVADDDGGSEEGLVSALRQFRREVLRAVERTSEPNGGRGGKGWHWRIILQLALILAPVGDYARARIFLAAFLPHSSGADVGDSASA